MVAVSSSYGISTETLKIPSPFLARTNLTPLL